MAEGRDARAALRLANVRNLLRAASAKKISVATVRVVRKARRGRACLCSREGEQKVEEVQLERTASEDVWPWAVDLLDSLWVGPVARLQKPCSGDWGPG